jgi:hypothetical protein
LPGFGIGLSVGKAVIKKLLAALANPRFTSARIAKTGNDQQFGRGGEFAASIAPVPRPPPANNLTEESGKTKGRCIYVITLAAMRFQLARRAPDARMRFLFRIPAWISSCS